MPTKTRASISEIRLTAGTTRHPDFVEADLAASRLTLDIKDNSALITSRILLTVSAHALARRIQRGAASGEEDLLDDLKRAVDGAERGPLVVGGGYGIGTPGGAWRCRVVAVTGPDGSPSPVLAVRTWLSK